MGRDCEAKRTRQHWFECFESILSSILNTCVTWTGFLLPLEMTGKTEINMKLAEYDIATRSKQSVTTGLVPINKPLT